MPRSPYQAEWMSPQNYQAALKKMPVALVPWGAFEWHGPHLPLGVDGVKSHAVALRIAEALGGGVVLPPVYAGHRTLRNAKGMPCCIECKPATVMALVNDTLTSLDLDGARVIVLVPGHYGSTHRAVLTLASDAWCKERGVGAPAVWQASDFALAKEEPQFADWDNNDHAGMWETALMWALFPDDVHMDELEERPEGALREDQGILGRDPKRYSTRELGERCLEAIIRRATENIQRLLKEI